MKKRLIALLLSLLFIIPTSIVSFAVNPTSLEAPISATVRDEKDGSIILRWTVPKSVLTYMEISGELFYCVDWKVNNGPWHYSGIINNDVMDSYGEKDLPFFGWVGNLVTDEANGQEVFFISEHIGFNDFDFANDTYTFRVRFAFYDYDKDGENYLVSAFSNEASIGKNAQGGTAPAKLEAPMNLKVETRTFNGKPYFYLSWTNPASVDAANKSVPIDFKVDFKVGNDKWLSEKEGHDWWGANDYATHIDFDPVERDYTDKIVIEENTYYFRILYSYEPTYGEHIYSPYSNTVSIGLKASEWAKGELQGAFEAGLVPDILKGADLTKPINREEFCELAVLLYEKTTGIASKPAEINPFIDTTNPQILKAFALGITNGKDNPNTFKPKVLINRQECAAALFRAIKAIHPNGDYSIVGVKDFPDQKVISGWAVEAVKYMSKLGIIKGDAKTGNFMPFATTSAQEATGYGMATREAAVLMSVRTYNSIK